MSAELNASNAVAQAMGNTTAPSPEVKQETVLPKEESLEAKELEEEVEEEKKVEPPKSTKKKYKIKVDKNEEEFEFDPSNDEEVIKHLQRSRASDKRFQEAAEVRKAAMEFIDQLRKNPRKVLSDPSINVDIKKMAEEILNDQIADLEKTPEQREKEDMQRRLQEYEERAKKLEEDKKLSDRQKLEFEQEKAIELDISAALDIGGIPKTPRTVARMAEMMMIALKEGIDLSAKDIAPLVKNNTMSEFKELVTALSDDQLEDFIGKEVIGRLRKRNIAKAKAAPQTAQSVKSTGSDAPKKEEAPVRRQTIKEFLKA